MCGRYALFQTGRLDERFDVDWHEKRVPPVMPRYNLAPSQPILTVLVRDGRRVLEPAVWGFRPAWMKPGKLPPPINARAETLLERPMWKGALRSARCLIPADGFYEWRSQPGRRGRQPYFIRLRDREPFAFAGLYAEDEDGNLCAAIVTTSSEGHALMEPIHDRMPVILSRETEVDWLDRTISSPAGLMAPLTAYPAEEMEAFPVSPAVGNVRNDSPDLVEPVPVVDESGGGGSGDGETVAPPGQTE